MQAMPTMRDQQDLIEAPGGDAVRDELDRLLASPFFNHSRRFPNFLRFVVEHTLAGDIENIKERTLGIEIFGRDADYDTATDPIVRVTAAEIRKRVAQYYQDPAHNHELRISLPSGSYVPQFHWPSSSPMPAIREGDAGPVTVLEPVPSAEPHRSFWTVLRWSAVCVVVLAALGVFLVWQRSRPTAFDTFWQPVLSPAEPVLVCVADQLEYSVIELRDAADPSHQIVLKDNLTAIVIDDLDAVVKTAGILQSKGKAVRPQRGRSDQPRRPAAGTDGFCWGLRQCMDASLDRVRLRYHFANDATMTRLWIEDSRMPGQSKWVVERSVQMATNNYRDYAIVARFTDSNTGQVAVVIAGIGRGGTRVAGEFLTDNADLAQLMRAAKQNGDKKNMEAVLSTQIIDGEPGSPKMEAVYFW